VEPQETVADEWSGAPDKVRQLGALRQDAIWPQFSKMAYFFYRSSLRHTA